jgi:hypothetical protein
MCPCKRENRIKSTDRNFTQAGEVSANCIAWWNGSDWSALGSGLGDEAWALAVARNGDLYAGGRLIAAGGKPSAYVAQWSWRRGPADDHR